MVFFKITKKVDSKFSHQNRNESGKVATNELNLGILQYTTTSKHVIYHKHIKFLFNYIINFKIDKELPKGAKGLWVGFLPGVRSQNIWRRQGRSHSGQQMM